MDKKIAKQIIKCFKGGGKLLICGNGGSATMASHMAGEFLGHFEHWRKPLPAIALNDIAALTAIGNDYTFEHVFARQVEALGNKGDILIALSTSGKSRNVLWAMRVAKDKEMEVIDFPREGDSTAHIQENQLKLMHDTVREVEKRFI